MRQRECRVRPERRIERGQLRWGGVRGKGKRNYAPNDHRNRDHDARPEPEAQPEWRSTLFLQIGAFICVNAWQSFRTSSQPTVKGFSFNLAFA